VNGCEHRGSSIYFLLWTEGGYRPLFSLRVGRASAWLDPRGWTNSTLADRSEARVDHLANRPEPGGVLGHFHPALPGEIEEAGLSASPVLVEISRQIAAKMDSKVTIAYDVPKFHRVAWP
jgi:hypothetical protein